MQKSNNQSSEVHDVKMIEDLMKILKEKNLTEVSYETTGFNVTVKKEYENRPSKIENKSAVEKKEIEKKKHEEALKSKDILSENIGVYFYKDDKGKSKIEKGKKIKIGDEIGYVLTLGVKNNVKSKYAGTIEEIYVDNASPVDYGKPLIKVKE